MRVRKFLMALAALFLVSLLASGQTTPNEEKMPGDPVALEPGVVVEAIKRNSEGEKAGLQEGDVLLRWVRGDSKGDIESPFDIAEIETDQAPMGTVKLEGLRKTERQTWSLGPSRWGLTTRPNFASGLLSVYRDSQELAKAGKRIEAAARWQQDAVSAANYQSAPRWLAPWLLLRAASLLTAAKKWEEVDALYNDVVQRQEVTTVMVGQALWEWAESYTERGDWAHAEKYYLEAVKRVRESGDDGSILARGLNAIGVGAQEHGDLAKAGEYYLRALAIQERLMPDGLDAAHTLFNLGSVSKLQGDLAKAENYWLRSLVIQEKQAPDSLEVTRSLSGLGLVANGRGDMAKAEGYLLRALAICEKRAPDSLDLARILGNLGLLANVQGDLAKAEDYDLRTLAIQEKQSPGGLDVAHGLNNLGILAWERGDLVKAEEYHLRALAIREKLSPDGPDVAHSLGNLGSVAYFRGDMDKAEGYLLRALAIYEKQAPNSFDVARSFTNLGLVAVKRGDLAKAEDYSLRALAIQEKQAPGGLDVAATMTNLGELEWKQGDLAKAEDYNLRALAIREKQAPGSLGFAESLSNVGLVALDRGDLDKAEEYWRRALAIEEKLVPNSAVHAEVLAGLAGIMVRKGQRQAATQLYAQALTALESQSARLGGSEEVRSGFGETHSDIYRDYVDLLLALKQPDQAFAMLERSRARILLEMLVAAHVDIRKGADPSLLGQERALRESLAAKSDRRLRLLGGKNNKKQLAALSKEIEDLDKQYQEVEERLRLNSPGYAALTQPQPLDAQAVQRRLPDNTLLLEYSLGKTSSYVFAVTARSLKGYELPSSVEIEGKAQHLYQLFTERSRIVPTENDKQRRTRLGKADAEFRNAASELSRILLGPVTADLQQRRLLIVSDGALQYIPFAALPTPGLSPRKPSYPLIVQHEIINLPSASVLAFLRHNTAANKEVVVFADPVFDNHDSRVKSDSARLDADTPKQNLSQESRSLSAPSPQLARDLVRSVADMNPGQNGELHLPRLAFTRDEAKAILAVVPQGSSMEAIDFDASRKRAMSGELARYRVVHFATHALVDNIHPELSGLVLSLVDQRGESVDGFLGLQDIYNLDLSADLVVLSACQTALGKQINDEGMIGLTRGFMYAGASGVMATLWNVNDFATAKLMAHFYKAMERDGMTPAQALRQAQLALWKEQPTAAPYYWAGFILQGGLQ